MLVFLILVIVLCIFTSGMNFSVWLTDKTLTKNLMFAIGNMLLGVFNLVSLVGYSAKV